MCKEKTVVLSITHADAELSRQRLLLEALKLIKSIFEEHCRRHQRVGWHETV